MSFFHARTCVVFFLILMCIAGLSPGSVPAESEKGTRLEGLKIGSFQVVKADMEQALEALKRTGPSKCC
jgi:hypothetical protein